jgi:AAA family ATP:ADP antiporter
MRSRYSQLRFPVKEIERLLQYEAQRYGILAGQHRALRSHSQQNGSQKLLTRALEERLEQAQERIFRLLGLMYPPVDLFNAWNRLVHGGPSVRAAALELLGNLFTANHRESILPLLEALSWEEVHEQGKRIFGLTSPSFRMVLMDLLEGADSWLSACAVTLVGEIGLAEAREAVDRLAHHPDGVVREAAQSTRKRLES